jgi:hypothetical protein
MISSVARVDKLGWRATLSCLCEATLCHEMQANDQTPNPLRFLILLGIKRESAPYDDVA